jgi:tetratricopeptide (TPR) repeat protein
LDKEDISLIPGEKAEIISIAPRGNTQIIMNEAPDHNNSDVEALLAQALTEDQIGAYPEMLITAQQAVELQPDSGLAFACKARALQKLERISEATAANDQALLLDKNLPLAWINRSGLQLLQQRFPDGLRSAMRAIELAPDDARAWANKGVALFNLNNLSGALEAINQSLTFDPGYLFALQIKGEILYRYGRMHELIQTMRHVLELAPTEVRSLVLMIQACRALEEYDELPPLTKRLTQLQPDALYAWESHMRTLRALGRFADADEAIEQVLVLAPGDVRMWTLKADNLYRQERYREAAQVADYALRLNQQYPPARRIHEKAIRLMYQRKGKRPNHT